MPGPALTPKPAIGAQAGNVHSRREPSTSNPASTIERSASRCVWQLPNSRGQNVASTARCHRPRLPALATCSRYRSCPPGPQHRIQAQQHRVGLVHRAQHQRAHHRVERLRVAELLDRLAGHGNRTGAPSAAPRARAASRGSGSTAITCRRLPGSWGSWFRYPRRLPAPGRTSRTRFSRRSTRTGSASWADDDGPDPREEWIVHPRPRACARRHAHRLPSDEASDKRCAVAHATNCAEATSGPINPNTICPHRRPSQAPGRRMPRHRRTASAAWRSPWPPPRAPQSTVRNAMVAGSSLQVDTFIHQCLAGGAHVLERRAVPAPCRCRCPRAPLAHGGDPVQLRGLHRRTGRTPAPGPAAPPPQTVPDGGSCISWSSFSQ